MLEEEIQWMMCGACGYKYPSTKLHFCAYADKYEEDKYEMAYEKKYPHLSHVHTSLGDTVEGTSAKYPAPKKTYDHYYSTAANTGPTDKEKIEILKDEITNLKSELSAMKSQMAEMKANIEMMMEVM